MVIYGIKKICWNEPLYAKDFFEVKIFDVYFKTFESAKKYIEEKLLPDYISKFKYFDESKEYNDRNDERYDDSEGDIYTSFTITEGILED